MKQSKAATSIVALFPNYFKKIGLGMILITIGTVLTVKFLPIEVAEGQREIYKVVLSDLFILGLFFIAWSRDKFEDEMTLQIRLKAVGFTFMTSVFYLVLRPFADIIIGDAPNKMTAIELMIFMLSMYIIFYKLQKRSS
ncbi:hypothetical protein ACI6PS_03325 [Flavobacterium sp. PLA-1-15]|uniref:hypothetical protein n=1 Tax=Flavobacterium sp. PLA-1-15 TaxID=3380533 RepID=UPI003B7707AC